MEDDITVGMSRKRNLSDIAHKKRRIDIFTLYKRRKFRCTTWSNYFLGKIILGARKRHYGHASTGGM